MNIILKTELFRFNIFSPNKGNYIAMEQSNRGWPLQKQKERMNLSLPIFACTEKQTCTTWGLKYNNDHSPYKINMISCFSESCFVFIKTPDYCSQPIIRSKKQAFLKMCCSKIYKFPVSNK